MICGTKSTVGPAPFNWVGFGIVEVPVAVFGATMYAVEDEDICKNPVFFYSSLHYKCLVRLHTS
jgi:hypothetical protein